MQVFILPVTPPASETLCALCVHSELDKLGKQLQEELSACQQKHNPETKKYSAY
jgi:hypothetical protein